jgi:hypothetical protein
MGSRNLEKDMLKRFGILETYAKMVNSALKSFKTKSKKVVSMKKELRKYFLALRGNGRPGGWTTPRPATTGRT